MYTCLDCGFQFENPLNLQEKHGLDTPPFETLSVCPHCKSSNYETATNRYCHCCGAKMPDSYGNYCSKKCENRGKKLWQRQHDKGETLYNSEIYKLVREIDSYNQLHKTRISYGQYVSLFKRKVKPQCKTKRKF
jgi:predicted amidophosphoribosyltransferase